MNFQYKNNKSKGILRLDELYIIINIAIIIIVIITIIIIVVVVVFVVVRHHYKCAVECVLSSIKLLL